jgi:Ca2+-transporting ATPase
MLAHRMSIEETLAHLKSSTLGLSQDEAGARHDRYGPNELIEKKKKAAFRMFLDQFTDFMILVLIVAAIVSGLIGEPIDAIAIMVIVLLNALLGFTQEYRAEKAIAALKKMAAPHAVVLRGNEHRTIPASELVPGDVVLLEAGNIVPADMRIMEAARLKADEAALTGESVPVEKHSKALPDDPLPIGDQKNMLFKGTSITYGRGAGVVTAIGMDTELGRIAAMLQQEDAGKTPLQKRLTNFGTKLAVAVLAICGIIFVAGLIRGDPPITIFLVAVSLAVAAIPEALPAVVTISLAFGARKMANQNALIRKLPAVETLGSVTYICTDKTGTLTQNRMTVEELWVDGKVVRMTAGKVGGWDGGLESQSHLPTFVPSHLRPHRFFFTALALSNDARLDSSGTVIGDPTEAALFSVASKNGFNKTEFEASWPRIAELPFDSERKLMTTIHNGSSGQGARETPAFFSFTKGAVEVLLSRCETVLTSNGSRPINIEELTRESDRIAADGLRVMAIAMRTWDELPAGISHETIENNLVLLGLVGMLDPPREEAKEAVSLCKNAGITPIMITGDHPLTAKAIAMRVGILEKDAKEAVISGVELNALSLETFEKRVESIRVYARVAPEQKLKIVKALQDKGHYVAMTGDGVNDAPALKRADIGVSMGITGTDVAKEASAMILLDDNFATIVKAVREGRRIYDNIRKVVRYLLSTNSGEIWTLFLAPFVGLPIPLQPIHILWINLMTDGLPALALTKEPEEGNVMKRPPRPAGESLFARGLGVYAVWVGLLMAGTTLSLQAWSIHIGDAHWQTMVFTVLCFLQLGQVLAIRFEKQSFFTQGIFTNKPLLLSIVATIGLQLCTIYVPALNPVFKTQPLSIAELFIALGLSSTGFLAAESVKWFKRLQKTS